MKAPINAAQQDWNEQYRNGWNDAIAALHRNLERTTESQSTTVGEEEIKRFRIGDILFSDEQAKMFCDLAQKGLRAETAPTEEDVQRTVAEIFGALDPASIVRRIMLASSATRSNECVWVRDTDGCYATGCGHHLAYEETLEDCGVEFCQCCGGKMREVK